MDPFLNTFDEFVDDLLSSETELLKCELDIVLMQHLFQSIDIKETKNKKFNDCDFFAA